MSDEAVKALMVAVTVDINDDGWDEIFDWHRDETNETKTEAAMRVLLARLLADPAAARPVAAALLTERALHDALIGRGGCTGTHIIGEADCQNILAALRSPQP